MMNNVETDDPFLLMQEKHVMSIILYLNEHGPCRKTDIYSAVSRGTRMPDKLEGLQKFGIIEIVKGTDSNRSIISLTDKGRKTGELISIMRMMVRSQF